MVLESPFAAALNHLLASEPWARERLAPFAGADLELRAPALPALRFAVREDGRLAPAAPGGAAPALVVTLKPEALPALAQGEAHLLRAVEVSGNAHMASEVMLLVRHLRWDFEDDLARVVGDVAAHRLARLAREAAAWHADAARRLAEAARDYAVEERRVLLGRAEFTGFAAEVAQLRDALERLEARLRRAG